MKNGYYLSTQNNLRDISPSECFMSFTRVDRIVRSIAPLSQILTKVSVFILVLTASISASNNGAAFIDNGLSARSVSLGQSITGAPYGAEAIYWNPSVLAGLEASDLEISVFNAFETQFYSGFYSMPVTRQWSIGVGLAGASTDGIPESIYNSSINRYILTGVNHQYTANALFLSSAYSISNDLSLGVNVKGIQEQAAGYTGSGAGVDIGAHYTLSHSLSIGILAKNIIQPAIEWNTPSGNIDHAPQEILLGGGARLFEDSLLLTAGTRIRSNRDAQLRVGAEYFVDPRFALRAGHDGSQLSLGIGLRLTHFRMNISWTNPELDIIEDMYRFSIGYQF